MFERLVFTMKYNVNVTVSVTVEVAAKDAAAARDKVSKSLALSKGTGLAPASRIAALVAAESGGVYTEVEQVWRNEQPHKEFFDDLFTNA